MPPGGSWVFRSGRAGTPEPQEAGLRAADTPAGYHEGGGLRLQDENDPAPALSRTGGPQQELPEPALHGQRPAPRGGSLDSVLSQEVGGDEPSQAGQGRAARHGEDQGLPPWRSR